MWNDFRKSLHWTKKRNDLNLTANRSVLNLFIYFLYNKAPKEITKYTKNIVIVILHKVLRIKTILFLLLCSVHVLLRQCNNLYLRCLLHMQRLTFNMIKIRQSPWGHSGERYPKHLRKALIFFFFFALGKTSHAPKSSKQKFLDLWKNARVRTCAAGRSWQQIRPLMFFCGVTLVGLLARPLVFTPIQLCVVEPWF